jgi:hypothetical protein
MSKHNSQAKFLSWKQIQAKKYQITNNFKKPARNAHPSGFGRITVSG